MRDDFKFFRRYRNSIYLLLCLLNRISLRLISVLGPIFLRRFEVTGVPSFGTRPTLLVYRSFGGSNEALISRFCENVRELSESPVEVRHREGSTIFGNSRWLINEIIELVPSQVIVLDPQLIGLPSAPGIFECIKLLKLCHNRSIRLCLVLFDLHDPQGVLFSSLLTESGHDVLLMCSSQEEAFHFFGIRGTTGPALESAMRIYREPDYAPLSKRKIHVHLPRPSYEPRKTFVRKLQKQIEDLPLNLVVGGQFDSLSEFQESLCDSKIAVVTTSVALGGVGAWPKPKGPSRHLVSYCFEALAAGCLLVAERCVALDAVLREGTHYVGFETINEADSLIRHYLQNPLDADQIAKAGHEFLVQLAINQTILKRVLQD